MNNSLISKKARIGRSVVFGPYVLIEDDVEIGDRNIIGSHVVIRNGTVIGDDNRIHSGVQIGVDPQDYHFKGEYSRCIIGNNNIIREYATISRATGENSETVIGDNNFIMTYVHIAHNITIGSNTVISSGSQLGGYVSIADFANIGGLAGIHQFCRVGRYAMLGAKSYLNKDLPPYLLARGNRAKIYGVNTRGLKFHSFSAADIETIKELFNFLYNSAKNISECVELLKKKKNQDQFTLEMVKFIESSERGILLKISD
ncbi:MAG TPA: acyl-ACP--UDP-N-acetylglucosamine O-acyltransferase [candidate division WOR-3 bacterium]|uniref:Acyl-ACP--UDP-N-acetylglucosamine O-acyltransferase n=1 Tax=candidate division WOR-3 bacterium TaxID=2052148 RepID=A0A9C9EMT1_UNCW3|nr:acyl-ACP--UDP-N-acetylglucosamine O-acyltransferase [candidate division WOR-3 bacterium]